MVRFPDQGGGRRPATDKNKAVVDLVQLIRDRRLHLRLAWTD